MTDLHSLVNGEALETVPINDRGLMYGDGLFETMRVTEGQIIFWSLHMQRLAEGCRRLAILMPDEALLAFEAAGLVEGMTDGILKLVVTRGAGGRGYKTADITPVTRVMTCHPAPEYPYTYRANGVHLRLCNSRLSRNPLLAGIKHLNRLEQVLARLEWNDDEIAEGIMFDTEGLVIEGVMSNLFMVSQGQLITPDLSQCGVAGIARSICLAVADQCKLPVRVESVRKDALLQADEVFLTNSINGIWPVCRIDDVGFSPGDITQQLLKAFSNRQDTGITWRT